MSTQPPTRGPAKLRGLAVLTGMLVAVPLLQAIGPANAAPDDPQTIVSLTFDDSYAGQATAAGILNAHNMDATFYTVSGWVGAAGHLTREQLSAISAAGHEIGGHTATHADLTTSSAAEARRQTCIDRATLLSWGFPITSFAYPYAAANPNAESIVRDCGYNSARGLGDIETRFSCTGCGFSESLAPANPYNTRAPVQFDENWTLADLQNTVVNAEERGVGGWIQFTFHNVCDNCPTDALAISPALLTQFAAWLAPRAAAENTHVRTVGQVIGGEVTPAVNVDSISPPAPGPGVNGLINPSLEAAGTGSYPQCWQQYGYGSNTAAFAVVNPGRTGNVAERMTMSGYTNGDARLMPVTDLGECAPTVTPGHTYSLRAWYTSTAPTQFAVYLRTGTGTWQYWTSSPLLNASATYTQAEWTSPAIPAGTTGISFGLNLVSNGTLTTDDYAVYDTVGAPPVGGPPPVGVTTARMAGADRFATAVAVSQSYAPGVSRVYVANGFAFPDALSASPAAANVNAPVLLTAADSLPANVRAELVRLNPGQIVLVGGPAAVSDAVLGQLQAIAQSVRVFGADRYATSRAIATHAFGTGAATAYVATGVDFPDALSASPAAAHFNGPIVLVPGTASTIDDATRVLLSSLGTTTVKIAGGPAAVTPAIENALRATAGVTTVTRHAGADRYSTAAAINQDAFATSATAYLAVEFRLRRCPGWRGACRFEGGAAVPVTDDMHAPDRARRIRAGRRDVCRAVRRDGRAERRCGKPDALQLGTR